MSRTLIPHGLGFFRRDLDDLFETFFRPNESEATVTGFAPRTDLIETEDEYEITLDLPGVKSEEFNVELDGNELSISGERKHESEEKGKTYHHVERHYGKFRRVLTLHSDVDAKKINAEYKDGVLRVTVPKAEAAKPIRIEIKS